MKFVFIHIYATLENGLKYQKKRIFIPITILLKLYGIKMYSFYFWQIVKTKVCVISNFLRNPPRDATFEIVVDMSIRALWIVPIVRQSTADLLQDNIIFTRYCVLLLQQLPLIIKQMFTMKGGVFINK